MSLNKLKKWIYHHISINKRLEIVATYYLLFLMIEVRKHSLEESARFSGLNKSQFSKFLSKHQDLAIYSLDKLSKKQAKQCSKTIKYLKDTSLWKVAILIDSTIENRSSIHTENSQKFNHGQGFVIGHQWTNILLIINDMIIPLPPIPYYTKKYCRENGLKFKTEHDSVVEYLNLLNLEEYIGQHDPKEVVVIADSGYDDKKIEKAIDKKWNFIIALKEKRSVKSENEYQNTPKSKDWSQVVAFFKNHRRLPWQTILIPTDEDGKKKKRMEFRARQAIGYLRDVGRVQLVCSEWRKRPDGRRKHLACNDLRATARQILIGYRIRWLIETFHKEVKTYLGFEDVATQGFASVQAHIHWVYCAYLLLHAHPPGVPEPAKTIAEKQRRVKQIIDHQEKRQVLQQLTQIGGVERYKNQLRRALAAS